MLTESPTLKYCECPDPVVTDQEFCPDCGTQYRSSREESQDILQPDQIFGSYRVLERQHLWAVLVDQEGEKYRFWPMSSVTEVHESAAEEESNEVAEGAGDLPVPETVPVSGPGEVKAFEAEALPPISTPEEGLPGEVPAPQEPPPTTVMGAATPALDDQETTGLPEAAVPTPQEEDLQVPASTDPEPQADPAEPGVPALESNVQELNGEAISDVVPMARPLLAYHAFIHAEDVGYAHLRGRLEPLQPPKFSGSGSKSIRELLHADPNLLIENPDRVLGWMVQCAQAMKAAHDQGILVNSFTPDTVFIDVNFNSRPERVAISTALYAAPFAQAVRVTGYAPLSEEPLTPAADIYQLGALLRDLLLLKSAERADAAEALDDQELFRRPMALVRLALKLMHHNPQLRPQNAQALKELLMATQQTFQHQHTLNVAGMTDVGLNRDHNEDAFAFAQFEEQAGLGVLSTTVLVVCDGVGGSNAGEEASRLATREVLRSLCAPGSFDAGVANRLEAAVLRANAAVLALSQEFQGAGCTLVLVYVRGQRYWVAHVGDSRAYKCVNGLLTQLTEDHSWTAQQIRKGLMTPDEARIHDQAHMIYRSLGERERLEVEVQGDADGLPLEPGTTFLLCTDGLTDVVDPAHLELLLSRPGAPRTAAKACVVQANASGGPDNITALIAVQEDTL